MQEERDQAAKEAEEQEERHEVRTTGILDPQAVVTFHPGTKGAREKLQWTLRRVTMLQEEDIVSSQFGVFGIDLPATCGERKQNALGR